LWKLVNLSAKLITDEGDHPSVLEKLLRAVSRDLDKPAAQKFASWIADRVKSHFAQAEVELQMLLTQQTITEAPQAERDTRCIDVDTSCIVKEADGHTPGHMAAVETRKKPCSDKLAPASEMPISEVDSASSEASLGKDEAWVEVKSQEGRIYFWDRRTNKCTWKLPAGIQPMWTGHKSIDGRSYYSDCHGKVFWVMPPLKPALAKEDPAADSKASSVPPMGSMYLPDLGLVVPVDNLPAAAPVDVYADLGPFTDVFPVQGLRVEAALDHGRSACKDPPPKEEKAVTDVEECKNRSSAQEPQASRAQDSEESDNVASTSAGCDASSDVTSLREELAELRRQLASLTDKDEANVQLSVEDRPLQRKRRAEALHAEEDESKEWQEWNMAEDEVAEASPGSPLERSSRPLASANIDDKAESEAETVLSDDVSDDVEPEVPAMSSRKSDSSDGSRGSSRKPPCRTALADKEDLASPLMHSPSRRARSRSPHGALRSQTKTPTSPQDGKSNGVLDKFLTLVRHGKPPGNWERSPSKIWGKGSAFTRSTGRRASCGGA